VGQAKADIIVGPTLNQTEGGHAYHGIDFTALTNSTLTGFLVGNQGKAEAVVLQAPVASGTVFHSVSIPASSPSFTVSGLDWALTAGTEYWLVATTETNGLYATFSGFPVSDAQISVNSGVFDNFTNNETTSFWGDFNNIETAPLAATVPEPSSLALLGLGTAAFAGWRRWQNRKRVTA